MANNLKHPVYDVDTHFIIDPISREMSNTACLKTCLIQHDHNSERFTFEVPTIVEGHDMSKCDLVQVHYLNIDAQTKAQSAGVYDVDDLTIDQDNPERVVGSWLISHNATEYVGSLNFLLRFACYGTDGNISYVWNTAIYSGISISNGIDNGEAVFDDYADILNDWRRETEAIRLMSLEQTVTSTESEGLNVWTATFADGLTKSFEVRNGKQGPKGDTPGLAKLDGDAGLVKLDSTSGIVAYGGGLELQSAYDNEIDMRLGNKAITPQNLDRAVKSGIVSNYLSLTDEEKTAVKTWLGISESGGGGGSAIRFITYSQTLNVSSWMLGGSNFMTGVAWEYDAISIGRTPQTASLKVLLVDISPNATLEQRRAAEEACIYASYSVMEPPDEYDWFVYIGVTSEAAPTVNIPITITAIFEG